MEEKNELGDIILNKNTNQSNSKKIILASATLGVILIVVILLMNTLNSNNESNLPQSTLPPKPQKIAQKKVQNEEPLFEDVEVIDETSTEAKSDEELDKITKKLKEQSKQENILKPEIAEEKAAKKHYAKTQKSKHKKVVKHKPTKKYTQLSVKKGRYYVQVGSFSRYKPNKKFLNSITSRGYKYTFYKVKINSKTLNKVLVGPFKNETEARKALKSIKKHIVKGAFIIKF